MSDLTPAQIHAAERRADRERALREELEGYERLGKTERAEQVRAELAGLGAPAGRSAAPAETADAAPTATAEAAPAVAKKRAASKRAASKD